MMLASYPVKEFCDQSRLLAASRCRQHYGTMVPTIYDGVNEIIYGWVANYICTSFVL